MRYSIQQKILVYFSIIIYIGLSLLIFAAYNITEQNTRNIIKDDMVEAKRNLDIYLKQYLAFNNLEVSEASIVAEAENLSKQLSSQIGNTVDIYRINGKKLSYGSAPIAMISKSEDLAQAMNGAVAYTINFEGDKVVASLSYPIEEAAARIGIVRYYKDYSEVYHNNKSFKNIINLFAILIFVIIFITSFIFSKQITKPIKKLAEASEEVSKGNFNVDININLKDEIGYLSSRFRMMVQKIREQIDIIKNDRDTLAEVQKQNKLFFDNITHELKTPITTIMGYAQAIEDLGVKNDEFTRKGLKCIISESSRLNNMVIELLELSKASSKNFSYDFMDVNLSELVKETCEEMTIKAKKYNISIDFQVQDHLLMKGDRDRLKEVLINLIDNSIKYGSVSSVIHISAYKQQKDIFLVVKDQGDGIPEEFIDKIFDPFCRVSKKFSRELGSAGLGLTIVKEIVERHGGGITIKSKLKQGTEVILQFGSEIL